MPKVSVIIPVYNVEKYLRQCLDSVVNQTLKDIEIICVDDGSTDNSLSILKEYAARDPRFIILTQNNNGAGAARNFGLEFAKGEYLYFLDSDDYLELVALESIYNRILETEADICIFINTIFDEEKRKYLPCNWRKLFLNIPDKLVFNKFDVPNVFFDCCNIPTWSKIYRTSFIKENKIKYQNLKTCNDVYFNFRSLVAADKITFLNEKLLTWRKSNHSLTKIRGKYIDCILNAFDSLKRDLDKETFRLLEDTFYNRAMLCFNYEIKQLMDPAKMDYWSLKLYEFIPKKYWPQKFINLRNRIIKEEQVKVI